MKDLTKHATNYKAFAYRLMTVTAFIICMSNSLLVNAFDDKMIHFFDERDIIAGNYSAFCRDKEGFLWVGTDQGLICFDGNNCDIYRNDELDSHSISDNKVFCIYNDSSDRIWVGTVSGLNYYDRATNSFRMVNIPEISMNGFISNITELPDKRLLFVVAGVGLYTVDVNAINESDPGISAKRMDFGYKDDGISCILNAGRHGTVLSTNTGEVLLLTPGGKVLRLAQVEGNVSKISLESPESLVFATLYEAFRLDIPTRKLTRLVPEINEKIKITHIQCANGITYLSTTASGLCEVDKDSQFIRKSSLFQYSRPDLSQTKIGCVYMDHQGDLWFGCNHVGVIMIPSHNGPFTKISLHKELLDADNAEITCIASVGNRIAAGLNNGNVLLIDTYGEVRKIEVSKGVPVTSLAAGSPGHLWIGMARDGIWDLDLTTLHLDNKMSLPQQYPGVSIASGVNGKLIAAFSGVGVMRYDIRDGSEKWFYPMNTSNLLSCSYYSGLSATSDGKIWIGGYSGLACYDCKKDCFLPINQTPFMKGVVHSVCEYGDKDVLIGTDRGLVHYSFEKGVMEKLTMLDGLPDNDVRTLLRDGKDGIWIGTMKGLAYFSISKKTINTYGGSMDLSRTSYGFSGRIQQTGQLVMGDYESLIVFHPDSVKSSTFARDIRITGIYINGKKLCMGIGRDGRLPIIEGGVSTPSKVRLSYKDNSIMLRLSTMDFRDSSDLRYEWQFDDEGDVWHSTAPGESFITLTHLESGSRIIRIRGRENDVCSEVKELKLDILPPWYLSNIAYAVYVTLIIAMAFLIYKVLKDKREEELYEARIKYFMDISHELRSPITLMISPVDTLLKEKHSPQTTSQLIVIRRNAQRVLNLVDQLLDLRKIEKGKMRLIYEPTDIKAHIEELVEIFRPQAEEKGLNISFHCMSSELWGAVDRNNLDKILVNLISNAIKYTPDGGEVNVELKEAKDSSGSPRYVVSVTDTGIGLDSKTVSKLFERFYRNRENHRYSTPGFGIGLDLCMRLVALHKGEITAHNREDGIKGSVFKVSLPLNHANPEDFKKEENQRGWITSVVPSHLQESSEDDNYSHNRFSIMVVDDDKELREYIKKNLGPAYKVSALANGVEALKKIGETEPELIVTDIRMDGMDGLELLRRVKTNMSTQHIPVILLGSANGIEERSKGWKLGADGYLAKPFSITELESMISGLLSTRSKLKGKFSGSQKGVDAIAAPKLKGIDEKLMNKVNKYINDNISETALNVDSLSDYVGLSRSQLHRRMKEITGISPSDYIRNVKLKNASSG